MMDHTEVTQIDYDDEIITYDELLDIFWKNNICKVKSLKVQYRSLILYHDEEQRIKALKSKDEKEKNENSYVYTDIEAMNKFYIAENYHQKYYLQSVRAIADEIKKSFESFNAFVDSKFAARLNGYIKGYGDIDMLRNDLKTDLLSDKSKKRLISIVDGYGK
ncbi:peptide-methionine (S)-S-oxide reductase [Tepidibacter aestuarii]|nr:peptide-methionine (S)-S-oxide reductase [Tepidibacter aestuarii]